MHRLGLPVLVLLSTTILCASISTGDMRVLHQYRNNTERELQALWGCRQLTHRQLLLPACLALHQSTELLLLWSQELSKHYLQLWRAGLKTALHSGVQTPQCSITIEVVIILFKKTRCFP